MKYRIIISSLAEAEIDNVFLQVSKFTSPIQASQWKLYEKRLGG